MKRAHSALELDVDSDSGFGSRAVQAGARRVQRGRLGIGREGLQLRPGPRTLDQVLRHPLEAECDFLKYVSKSLMIFQNLLYSLLMFFISTV